MSSRPFHHSLQEHENQTLLTRSMLLGVTVLVVFMTFALIWAIYQDHQQALQRAGERLQTQLRAYSSAVDIAFMSADHALRHSQQMLLRDEAQLEGAAGLRPLLLGELMNQPSLDSLTLYGRDGTTLMSTGLAAELRAGAPLWLRKAMAAGTHTLLGSSGSRLAVGMLVTGSGNELLGALVVTIDSERIRSELETGDDYGGQQLLLVGPDNQPLSMAAPAGNPDVISVLERLEQRLPPGEFEGSGTRLMMGDQYLVALRQLSQHPIRALAVIDRRQAIAGWQSRAQMAGTSLAVVLILTLAFLNQWRKSAARERQTANDLAHLYQAIEQIPSAITITDLEGRIIYVNKAYLARSGLANHQVMGQKPNILSSGITPSTTYHALWRRLKNGQPWEGEFTNRMSDGRERVEQAVITPVRDVDGVIACYFSIASDITEKREADRRLSLYQVIVDASSELLALVGTDYRYLQVNNSYLNYHALERHQIEGRRIADLWGEAFFEERIRPQIDRVFAGQAVSYEEWFEFAGKGRRYCRISCRPIHANSGKIETVVVSISDMTSLKLSEEALRTSEQRFRALAEFSPMGIFETDEKGYNVYSNRYFCEMVGRTPQQLLGKGWAEVVHPDDRVAVSRHWWKTVRRRQAQWDCQARMVDAQGKTGWFQSTARRYEGAKLEESRYIGIVLDITEQIERRQELEVKNQELERLSTTDLMTGLTNRGRLEQLLAQEVHRFQRYGTGFGVIMLDVDHFKDVNDNWGHNVGDQVLRRIATLLRENTRLSDCVGRWGGEEFMICCPGTDLNGTLQLAEELRKRIAKTDFPVIGLRTCSFGVTAARQGDRLDDLLKRVDEALYQAKAAGRNRVTAAVDPSSAQPADTV